MAKFSLVLDADSLERRAGAPTVGAIHVVFGAAAFPSDDWSDFALEFLAEYFRAVLRLRKSIQSSVSFYEGPYELKFRRTGDVVRIDGMEQGKVSHSIELPFLQLVEQTVADVLPLIEHEEAVRL